MPLTADGQNAAADGFAGVYDFLALFNGDPEGAGTEISGGAPAYARQAITWPAASGGSVSASNVPIQFDVPAGATVTHVAWFSALNGGTRGASQSVTSESFGAQGTYDVTTLTYDPLAS